MHFVIGGAWQGKLDYAKKAFDLKEEDIFRCTAEAEPDFSRPCLTHYEQYVLYCIRKGTQDYYNIPENCKVIIADDIF